MVITMIQIGNNIIVNADDPNDIMNVSGLDPVVLSCGLAGTSTVTASSIQDDGFTFCLQRSIFTVGGNRLSPQEFNVKWFKKPDDIFSSLAAVTTLLLCDVKPEIFELIRF